MRIERARVTDPGDPSVGIQEVTVYIGDQDDWLFDTDMFEPEDADDELDEFREHLLHGFGVFMENPRVFFQIDGKWEDEPPDVEPDPAPPAEVGLDDIRKSDHWE